MAGQKTGKSGRAGNVHRTLRKYGRPSHQRIEPAKAGKRKGGPRWDGRKIRNRGRSA